MNIYRKSLQNKVIDENGYKPLGNFFTKYLDETKKNSFL